MRRVVLTLILCVSSVSLSAASELSVFYTASFGTSRSMSPSRAEGGPARNAASSPYRNSMVMEQYFIGIEENTRTG